MKHTEVYKPGFHPVCELFPRMDAHTFAELKADIQRSGLLQPIWLDKPQPHGMIIDGRNRYLACVELGIEPRFEVWDGRGGSMLGFVLSLNLQRRHLNESQRAMVAAKAKRMVSQDIGAGRGRKMTKGDAAAALNVSPRSVFDATRVVKNGIPELQRRVERGEIAVSAAATIAAAYTRERQEKLLAKGAEAVQATATKLRETAKAVREKEPHLPSHMPPPPPAVNINREPAVVYCIETKDGRGTPLNAEIRVSGGVRKVVFDANVVADVLNKTIHYTAFMPAGHKIDMVLTDVDGWAVECEAVVVSHIADRLELKTPGRLQFVDPGSRSKKAPALKAVH